MVQIAYMCGMFSDDTDKYVDEYIKAYSTIWDLCKTKERSKTGGVSSGGNTWNYLMVYDGWNSSPSYLNYTCAELYFCEASYFGIEK